MSLATILEKIRIESRNTSEKGRSFEKLTKGFFQTDPRYAEDIEKIWLWMEFPFRDQFGGIDTGIDVVAKAEDGYWAIQCKCYKEDYVFSQEDADSFIAASAKKFKNEEGKTITFARRFWVSSNREFGLGFERKIENQDPPVIKLSLNELENAAVDWDKLWEGIHGKKARLAPKELRRHQKEALELTRKYFQKKDRGKLIMACGTGKTFTALRIAEDQVRGKEDGGLILCLVPSIALVSQMLREWTADAVEHINAICVCSDPKVVDSASDDAYGRVADLPLPASTDPEDVAKQIRRYSKKPGPTVIFSTYHSIRVISDAQKLLGNKGLFDLIICDEAHRTTGVTLAKDVEEGLESAFVKVHDDKFLHAKKRLYMTATPRLYTESAKAKAEEAEAILCSMDDEKLYGEEIYRLGFGAAVKEGLLSDYKVLVLVLSETQMKKHLQNALSDKELEETLMPGLLQKAFVQEEQKNPLVYVGKLIGCINALSKKKLVNGELISSSDPAPMRRAVAFCQTINVSRKTAEIFGEVQKGYFKNRNNGDDQNSLTGIETDHVDGTMTASVRDRKLNWLKAENDPEFTSCRILTNVRCLSEGVDVPALDAVLFLAPRSSQIDVVQSVGRVMRRAEGKKYGYIILPVVVPPGTNTEEILNQNERFKTVWSVLNALRAHDDRFDATINKIKLISRKDALPIHIVTPEPDPDDPNTDIVVNTTIQQPELNLIFPTLCDQIYVKMVEKVGSRDYLEKWAREVGKIATRHEARIGELIATGGKHKEAFDEFLTELRQNINPEIDEKDAIEMLAQHIVSRPVFDALFAGSAFTKNNAISKSMTKMLAQLEDEEQEDERKLLEQFQDYVQTTVEGFEDLESKQTVIVELYEKFFKAAYPKIVEKLGIVYTPTEIVDFLIHSVERVLKEDFNSSLADKNVHILDPFTGTGTFITRLLQSGLIPQKRLLEKYKNEIHANEIVLLAYYIACVNIENAFAEVSGSKTYESFPGACLTDTFQLGEPGNEEMLFKMFPENSERVRRQKKTPIRVILGNPPYSVGQKSGNDNAQNQHYQKLEDRIRETYAARTSAQLPRALHDSYIKAFRWASDRIDENGGIIAFVTNGSWLDGNSLDGFRKCIEEEFSKIYVFNLRGNLRVQGAIAKKNEGEGVFPIKTPVALTILVKSKKTEGKKAKIFYRDVGDGLKKKEKLEIISNAKDVVSDGKKWGVLKPNDHGDWLWRRNEKFADLIPLVPDEKFDPRAESIFVTNSMGVGTNRDVWAYGFSRKQLCENMKRTIDFYNSEVKRFHAARRKNRNVKVMEVINRDPKKFKWDAIQKERDVKNGKLYTFSPDAVRIASYRPFQKQHLYFSRELNARVYRIPNLFPKINSENLLICLSGKSGTGDFSCIVTNVIPDLHIQSIGAQCFPLYYYDEEQEDYLFSSEDHHDGISDFALREAQKLYENRVTKEDIFYYIYGILHSEDYRKEFAANLKKEFPRVPFLESKEDFYAFSNAGRELADLHLNYETLPLPKDIMAKYKRENPSFRVTKMRFEKGKRETDHPDKILYNDQITIENIPPEAYDYVVSGRSAIGWVMDRYQVSTDKDSGIVNDPNLWCTEHDDPEYIVNMLRRVIYLSCETVKIVKSLPKIDFSEV